MVNSDAYGDGWMVKIKITNAAEVAGLMSVADYKTLVNA
jgi:glycine cleavage system H protein